MARDLNRLMEDLRNSREVFVTRDGNVEDATEAAENANAEVQVEGAPRPRTQLKPEVFGCVYVDSHVLEAMHAEAKACPVETGALVLGTDDSHVTEIIPSGPSARRTSGSYELDVAYLQPLLERAERQGLRFLGVWHSHPEGCDELSATDRKAARSILTDPDWGVSKLLLPLSVRRRGAFDTTFYEVDAPNALPKRMEIVIRSASRAARSTGEPDLKARVREDVSELRNAGWRVSVRTAENDVRFVDLRRADVRLVLVLPPEYPVSPPEVFAGRGGDLEPVPSLALPETDRWSSMRSVAQVAVEAADSLTGNAPISLVRRPRSWIRRLLRRLPSVPVRRSRKFGR